MWPSWDEKVFWAIHQGWHHRWLDPIMVFLTEPGPWKGPLFLLIGLLFLLRGRRGAVGLVVLMLTIAVSDQVSAHVLKPLFRRPRPAVTLRNVMPLFGVRHSYSFPSVHATNFFAAAPVTAAVFPEGTVFVYAYAAAVSISRIYVGDHYPFDTMAGAALGLFIGLMGRKAFRRAAATLLPRVREEIPPEDAPTPAPARASPVGETPSAGR